MWITRYYESQFNSMTKPGKVLTIYGSRQAGKTSLLKKLTTGLPKLFQGDGMDLDLQQILSSQNLGILTNAFKGYQTIFIDEAQKVPNIGISLKLLIDHHPEMTIIATGSSSFDLANQVGEPLTGRQNIYTLFLIAVLELAQQFGRMHIIQQLNSYLVYGTYPEVVTAENNEERKQYLLNLRNAYLLKDILELESIKSPGKLFDLLRLLAYQIGNQVSLNELGNKLGLAKQTVERYLDLLDKAFIIKKVQGFSKNLRKEITKTHRYYFWDNGVRNAIINNFNPVEVRDDVGMLWQNFMFMERIKKQEYKRIYANNFFWRTYDQKEIDMVEEREGKLYGYEFKWGNRKAKAPRLWLDTYANAEYSVINKDNFINFLCD